MLRPAVLFFVALSLSALVPGCDCSDESLTPNNSANNEIPDQGTDTETDMPVESVCDTCREDQICVDGIGGKECVCPPGTSRAEGVCVEDTVCMPSTCNGHGTCTQDNNGLQCACELGWTGDFCGECDTVNGWVADGAGGCTDDLCSTIQCNDRVCQVTNGTPTCVCPAGTQDDGAGGCTPDETCTATTCNGQGTCDDSGASPVCTCEEGWQQPNCQVCDTPAGYHPDGMGGCTNDPCLPNPCTAANQSGCVAQGITYTCECDPGHHLEAGACVVDQTCTPTSCSGQGVCDDAGGIVTCECDPGYAGTNCAACDAAAGYHDDGLGNCTMDACLPNPCTQIPNKTQCVTGGTGYICECAAGYHDDGAGGCTNDPCTPNLCAANNQACRVTNGAAECYVPACDDQNPCTTDTLVNGVCVFSNLPNNTSCSTNACTTGEVCSAGVCGGGSPRVCNDNNPCTDDSCDAIAGCVFTNDNSNIPDDGIACTVGSCSNGFASHTPSDALCNDTLFCNGVEVCQPQNPSANPQGCVTTNVPSAPPNPGPCATYGACNEATDSFPLNTLSTGAACNDGISCTTGDVCDASGACNGTPTTSCTNPTGGTCTTTTDIAATIDLPTVTVTTQITANGQALNTITSSDTTYNYLYAEDPQTRTRHTLAFWYWNNGNLVITYSERFIAGIYDILYLRGTTTSAETYVYRTDSSDVLPNGVTYLQRGVVFAAGTKTLNVDVPTAAITPNITVNGQPLSAISSNDTTYNYLYAVDVNTRTRHTIAFWYWNNGNPVVTYGERLVAGTYDFLFLRGTTTSAESYVYRTDASDIIPNGVTYLQRNVAVAAGPRTLNINIPTTTLTTNVLVGGQALNTISGNDTTYNYLYAIDVHTRTRHTLAFWYWNNGNPMVTYGERLVQGTYDVLFIRGTTTSAETYVYRTDASDMVPNGVNYIQKNMVISGPNQTLNLNIPTTTLNTTLQVDGQALNTISSNDTTYNNIYAVSKTAGTRHTVAFWYWNNGNPVVTYGERLVADTYDILFVRGTTTSAETYVYRTDSSDAVPNAVTYLQKDVVLAPGTANLTVNIPTTAITVQITANGQPLSAISSNDTTYNYLYAVDPDTGTRQTLAFWYWNNGVPVITSGERVTAGRYHILYLRGTTTSAEQYVYRTDATDIIPNGVVYLSRDVLIPAGNHTLNIDIPSVGYLAGLSVNGAPLSGITSHDTTYNYLYAVSRLTGTRHTLAFWYWNNGNPVITRGERFISGDYDLLFLRGTTTSAEKYVYRTDNSDIIPNAVKYIGQCIRID